LQRPFEILDAHSMSGSHWHNDFIGEPVSNDHQIFFSASKIHFVGGNHPGPLTEIWVVQVKFAPQIPEVLDRVAPFATGCIEDEK
jgi:hypothetical protein